jgi:hypothetical protein
MEMRRKQRKHKSKNNEEGRKEAREKWDLVCCALLRFLSLTAVQQPKMKNK